MNPKKSLSLLNVTEPAHFSAFFFEPTAGQSQVGPLDATKLQEATDGVQPPPPQMRDLPGGQRESDLD
ncbi:MAG: hypothetical protein ABSC23_12365 [Bryobacteraceae bacterium]|jgi:hypothetical protein